MKSLALRQQGCLNPHPERVTDELFQTREFFDPRDRVRVKYEMLRRVETEGLPVNEDGRRGTPGKALFTETEATPKGQAGAEVPVLCVV